MSEMDATYEDTVFDFDLNLLHQTPNNTVPNRLDKQRKSILIVKKKTVATDSLIRKYYAKREVLDQTEKSLLSCKEECKKICIDYRNALDTCTKLENDAQILHFKNKELEEKHFHAVNQCGAVQSHANQLQLLVKQHETVIESFKKENRLGKSNPKDVKKIMSLQKDKQALLKDICLFKDIVLGKIKLKKYHKEILQKYQTSIIDDCGEDSDEEINGHNDDVFEDVPSPFCEEEIVESSQQSNQHSTLDKNLNHVKDENIIIFENSNLRSAGNTNEYDCSTEATSVDTGRGSSLAYSDSEKCFHSPDYAMNNSPLSNEAVTTQNINKKVVDIATSPITVHETRQIATSPVQFDSEPTVILDVISKTPNLVDKALSPIKFSKHVEVSTSPIKKKNKGIVTSPLRVKNKTCKENHLENQEKECLERNNSNNICEDNISDSEIEMIFNTMRVSHTLITPLPQTPARTQAEDVNVANTFTRHRTNSKGNSCEEAAIVREENKKIQASMADLAKEVMEIKNLLKNQLLLNNSCVHSQDFVSNPELLNDNVILSDHELHINVSQTNNDSISVQQQKENKLVLIEEVENEELDEEHDGLYPDSDLIQIHDILDTNSHNFDEPLEDVPVTHVSHRLQFELEKDPDDCGEYIDKSGNNDFNNINTDTHKQGEICLQEKEKEKVIKRKRLTRLEKLRKNLLPKSKIKRVTPTFKKMRLKPKPLNNKRMVKESDSSVSLNDRSVYEKAVKIMAELKSKENNTEQFLKSNSKVLKVKVENLKYTLKEDMNKNSNIGIAISQITTNNQVDATDKKECGDVSSSPTCIRTTRSRSKKLNSTDSKIVGLEDQNDNGDSVNTNIQREKDENMEEPSPVLETKKPHKRVADDILETPSKRVLRSSRVNKQNNEDNGKSFTSSPGSDVKINGMLNEKTVKLPIVDTGKNETNVGSDRLVSYSDLQLFSDDNVEQNVEESSEKPILNENPKESILCLMVEKYGIKCVKNYPKKISDSATNAICKKIEQAIAQIIELPATETSNAMDKLVADVQNMNMKQFIVGLMKYLKDPTRKTELFNKINTPPAPPMTKSEQVLLYIVSQLQVKCPSIDVIDNILDSIEYNLFKLNRTPEFDAIESLSHFYAILCRYIKAKSRLRLFILDAMYCIQYKAIALIKQCIDVWMHILPLAHMGVAKSPLVTCLVYLLHFYKCEDRFNRVQDMRHILNRKYFYQITEWNEPKILEMLKASILDLREIPIEKKMLRMALIIISKRHGPKWCQNHIIKNLLLPIIEKESIASKIRLFCVSMLGPLIKPYPNDMRVHCEIVMNQLLDLFGRNPPHQMQEAIVTSLIYMARHNDYRLNQLLLSWKPKRVSSDFEGLLRDYVREKPLNVWERILSRIALS